LFAQDKSTEAALEGKKYTHILDTPYRWESWAAPKGKDGKLATLIWTSTPSSVETT
jgi:hypothetical protein